MLNKFVKVTSSVLTYGQSGLYLVQRDSVPSQLSEPVEQFWLCKTPQERE
jgi:hypothetical protein